MARLGGLGAHSGSQSKHEESMCRQNPEAARIRNASNSSAEIDVRPKITPENHSR